MLLSRSIETIQGPISLRRALASARQPRLTGLRSRSYLRTGATTCSFPWRRSIENRPDAAVTAALLAVRYFRYYESFFNSSGTGGNGGQSCEYPLSSGVATSERSVPSCTVNLWGLPGEYPSHRHTPA